MGLTALRMLKFTPRNWGPIHGKKGTTDSRVPYELGARRRKHGRFSHRASVDTLEPMEPASHQQVKATAIIAANRTRNRRAVGRNRERTVY